MNAFRVSDAWTVRAPALLLCVLGCSIARGQPSAQPGAWTLDQVLEAARSANARLPVFAFDVGVGAERVNEALGLRGPTLAIVGDLRYAPTHFAYSDPSNSIDEERLLLTARQPLYQGGGIRSRIDGARARLQSAHARYRIAEKDLELEVRTRYSEILQIEAEVKYRKEGIERLRTYLTGIVQRKAAGLGVDSDLVKTRVRFTNEEANVADGERRLGDARLQLNDLIGREPKAPLEIAPVPPPSPRPHRLESTAWLAAPDVLQAQADQRAAEADIRFVRSLRIPHFELNADTGLFGPGFGPSTSPNFVKRLRDDLGASITLNLSWLLWDFGVTAAQLEQARLTARQAQASITVARRLAQLQWDRAETTLDRLYREIETRSRTVPLARDSYVQTESLYYGGTATALEVLDAYSALIDAEVSYSQALDRYRVAEAQSLRWGTP